MLNLFSTIFPAVTDALPSSLRYVVTSCDLCGKLIAFTFVHLIDLFASELEAVNKLAPSFVTSVAKKLQIKHFSLA